MDLKNVKPIKSIAFDIQRITVSHMTTKSWRDIPHVSYIYEPDITDFYNEFMMLSRRRNKSGYKVSFNTIMVRVITEGLLSAPVLNSYIDYNHKKARGTVHIIDEINVSIPWLLPDGRMITPVIFGSEKITLDALSICVSNISKRIENTNIDELLYRAAAADTINEIKKLNISILKRILASKTGSNKIKGIEGREKEKYYKMPESERLTPKDIMCGTVTVSNVGSLYKGQRGYLSLLEIIPPQIFAVGIGSIQDKPGVYLRNGNKEIGIRKFLPMCLAFDHRAVDFNSIVPFIKKLDEIFARPAVIHGW